MFIELTKHDEEGTKIVFQVKHIVSFGPSKLPSTSYRVPGWKTPVSRICDVTDSGDSQGTGVMETYDEIKELVTKAMQGE
jgi:hypothetical protein